MVATRAQVGSISPFFIVRNLQDTISFYRDKLGFEITFAAPEGEPFFAILRRDGVQVFVKEIGEHVPPIPNHQRHEWARWDAFAFTEDPDGLGAEFNRRSEDLIGSVADTDDGLRGFEVVDPNGYVLFFGRPQT